MPADACRPSALGHIPMTAQRMTSLCCRGGNEDMWSSDFLDGELKVPCCSLGSALAGVRSCNLLRP